MKLDYETPPFGSEAIGSVVNAIGYYALVFALVGLLLSAGLWAVGAFSNNYTQSVNGKRGILIAASAALVVGAAPALIDYFLGSARASAEHSALK